ncbi:phosphotransferase [Staphylococcus capitis]|uniref:phosphotransferase n=1 Tax=Staphylococcus capitis TaxID=29388 RepID=UPI000D1A9E96|nr:phosphotransferase [Staphylococcus capitis]PTH37448.1 phosphotransferase [Staphylococcus capitis]HAB0417282.1 aminoglycoside phosphotransferase family protein [Listeria monocytogenes]
MSVKLRESRNVTSQISKEGNFYFKKILQGQKSDSIRRFSNLIKWDDFIKERSNIYSPKITNKEEKDLSLEYEWISNSRSLEDYLQDDSSKLESLIIKASKMLASLHTFEYKNIDLDNEKELPSKEKLLLFLDKYEYASCTGAELELYSLLQQDKQLIDIVTTREKNVIDYTLCHGDIRLDQFIYDGDNLWIIDFEELRIGDPSKDLAGIIGSLYFDCLLKTFSKTTQETSNEGEVEQQFIDRGVDYIEKVIPIIQSSIVTYKKVKEINMKQLSINIGWFIIERVMSRAKFTFRLSATDKAILGIGREIILNPHSLKDIF